MNQNNNLNLQETPNNGQNVKISNETTLNNIQYNNVSTINYDLGNNIQDNTKMQKNNRKVKILLAIIIVFIIMIVIIFFMLKTYNNSSSSSNLFERNESISYKSVKLTRTFDKRIAKLEKKRALSDDTNLINYFGMYDTEDTTHTIIFNKNGESLLKCYFYRYLGDDYILYDNEQAGDYFYIYNLKTKEIVYSYKVKYPNLYNEKWGVRYKNNVIYHEDITSVGKTKLVAYDLKKQKELWRVDGTFPFDVSINFEFGPSKNYIYAGSSNYESISKISNHAHPSTLIDFSGNVVIDGNNDDNETIEEEQLTYTYISKNDHYIKYKYGEFINIYNFEHKMISSLSLKEDELYTYDLDEVWPNGMYSIVRTNKNTYQSNYYLYNIYNEIILEADSLGIHEMDNVNINNPNAYFVSHNLTNSLVINNKVVTNFTSWELSENNMNGRYSNNIQDNYFVFSEYDNGIFSYKIANLQNGKVLDVTSITGNHDDYVESPKGEYIILNNNDKYYIYDKELNLKYESNNELISITDEFFLEWIDGVLYSINIKDLSKNALDVIGKSIYSYTTDAFVTTENGKYYLYTFN